MNFDDLRALLDRGGYSPGPRPPESAKRFSDGARWRVEIPSCEGPQVLEAVLDEADRRSVPVRRVSQGSGVMMLTDSEIRTMAQMGAEAGIEISLFIGPRGAWDVGGQALVTAAAAGSARGVDGLMWCVSEALRACDLGIRSLLVADLGVLALLGELRERGELPRNLLFKSSVLFHVANPATAAAIERLGAGTINVATDLSPAQLAEIRTSVDAPIDVYVEVPDDQGGFVRFYEIPDMITAAAPLYMKTGMRNSPAIYPSGMHLTDTAVKLGRERVRRAEMILRLVEELNPDLMKDAAAEERPQDLAIPEP